MLLSTATIMICCLLHTSHEFHFEDTIQANIEFQYDFLDVMDLGDRPYFMKRHPALRNSATKFLLEVYNEISEDQEPKEVLHQRHKRSANDDIMINSEVREKVENSHSIVTFSSRAKDTQNEIPEYSDDMFITFNTNDVPTDLVLTNAVLRIYKQSCKSKFPKAQKLIVSISKRMHNPKLENVQYRVLESLNISSHYKGWLEFNIAHTLQKWLRRHFWQQILYHNELRISVLTEQHQILNAMEYGIVPPNQPYMSVLEPFIIGYFNGPELMVKVSKLRFKRDARKRKHRPAKHPGSNSETFKPPTSCERLNFTVDFKELQMHNWVIAPKKFEAYFCIGGCNFPLSAKMNATNHAIVQTLIHLKQPHLPKACCVPITLGAITILRYLSEDIVDLTKYHKAVAKACGCH